MHYYQPFQNISIDESLIGSSLETQFVTIYQTSTMLDLGQKFWC